MRYNTSENTYADSTPPQVVATGARVGRKMEYPDKCVAPFEAGTFDRIRSVLAEGEDRTDLIRVAVERELERRNA